MEKIISGGLALIAAVLMALAFAVKAEEGVIHKGSVFYLPGFGTHCKYHEDYCPMGWLPDGTFPGVERFYALLEECGYRTPKPPAELPFCGELGISPQKCQKRCPDGQLVVSPAVCNE